MIEVNGKPYGWHEDLNVTELLKLMGYKLKKPAVLVKIRNEIIRRDSWDTYHIPDHCTVQVINTLAGG